MPAEYFIDYRTKVGSRAEKFYKAELYAGSHMLLGLNCLEPGQSHAVHSHEGQDKFYFVLEGEGEFTVGEVTAGCGPGMAVVAPAGVPHGVSNRGGSRLVILMGMAPGPQTR